jgi:methylmalonyl-CoA/ethylmalonyl-CoA epimerase
VKQAQRDITPFEVRQVGIVVKDMEKTMQQIRSILGIGPFKLIPGPEAIINGKKVDCKAKLAFAQSGPIEIELIEPVKGESTWMEFLRAKGEGVHHFGIFVPDIDKELARYIKMGVGVLQSGEDEEVKYAYMDTAGITGVIIELLQVKKNH